MKGDSEAVTGLFDSTRRASDWHIDVIYCSGVTMTETRLGNMNAWKRNSAPRSYQTCLASVPAALRLQLRRRCPVLCR
jgi:hypothetical protein